MAAKKYFTEAERKAAAAAYDRQWRKDNADRMRQLRRDDYARKKARMSADADLAATEREKSCRRSVAWFKTEKGRAYKSQANAAYRDRVKSDPDRKESAKRKKSASARVRLARDPSARIAKNVRNRIGMAVGKASKRALRSEQLLGCTIAEFRTHLESQWRPGMSWDNYTLDGWHIDHIRPLASFDLTDPEQQKIAFHYTNCQPLWAVENLSKSAKWEAA